MRLVPKCIKAMLENDKTEEIKDFEYNDLVFGENTIRAIASQAVLDELRKSLRERVKSIEARFSRSQSQSQKSNSRIQVERVNNTTNASNKHQKGQQKSIIEREEKQIGDE